MLSGYLRQRVLEPAANRKKAQRSTHQTSCEPPVATVPRPTCPNHCHCYTSTARALFKLPVVWRPGSLHRSSVLKPESTKLKPPYRHLCVYLSYCGLLLLINASRIFISMHFQCCMPVFFFCTFPATCPLYMNFSFIYVRSALCQFC